MKIDIWYKDKDFNDIAFVDCFFYPNSGEYRGCLYDSNKNMIGDFISNSSLEIEQFFPGVFN